MPRGVVLDSSVVVPHLRGELDITVHASSEVVCFLPVVVLGELYRGVLKSNRRREGEEKLDTFLRTVKLLRSDVDTAYRYALISDQLRINGTPLPENDVWIAATALQFGMPLATRDAHFSQVSDLQLLRW